MIQWEGVQIDEMKLFVEGERMMPGGASGVVAVDAMSSFELTSTVSPLLISNLTNSTFRKPGSGAKL